MTILVSINDAKSQLSKLIQHALNGEEVVITKNRQPVVRLTPIGSRNESRPEPGIDRGHVTILDNFDSSCDEFKSP